MGTFKYLLILTAVLAIVQIPTIFLATEYYKAEALIEDAEQRWEAGEFKTYTQRQAVKEEIEETKGHMIAYAVVGSFLFLALGASTLFKMYKLITFKLLVKGSKLTIITKPYQIANFYMDKKESYCYSIGLGLYDFTASARIPGFTHHSRAQNTEILLGKPEARPLFLPSGINVFNDAYDKYNKPTELTFPFALLTWDRSYNSPREAREKRMELMLDQGKKELLKLTSNIVNDDGSTDVYFKEEEEKAKVHKTYNGSTGRVEYTRYG